MAPTLWTYPPALGEPHASPFCYKMEAFLRLRGLPYTRRVPSGPPPSSTGKLPALQLEDGSWIVDSEEILRHYGLEHGFDPYEGIAEALRPTALLLRRTLEEHLYWGVVHDRWAREDVWPIYREAFFSRAPTLVRWFAPALARRAALAGLKGHGLGRLPEDQRRRDLADDVIALDAILGDSDWLLSSQPTPLDAMLAALVRGVRACPRETPLRSMIMAHPRLIAHADRLHAAAWPEATARR